MSVEVTLDLTHNYRYFKLYLRLFNWNIYIPYNYMFNKLYIT